jgi:hypothetical protein
MRGEGHFSSGLSHPMCSSPTQLLQSLFLIIVLMSLFTEAVAENVSCLRPLTFFFKSIDEKMSWKDVRNYNLSKETASLACDSSNSFKLPHLAHTMRDTPAPAITHLMRFSVRS